MAPESHGNSFKAKPSVGSTRVIKGSGAMSRIRITVPKTVTVTVEMTFFAVKVTTNF